MSYHLYQAARLLARSLASKLLGISQVNSGKARLGKKLEALISRLYKVLKPLNSNQMR